MEPVIVVPERHKDSQSGRVVDNAYRGQPIALGYLTAPAWTNAVEVTCQRPPFFTTFTNGILSTQFLLRVLEEDGAIEPGELEAHLRQPGDGLRNYLAGDVLPTMRDFFAQPTGRFRAALYELGDEELVGLLSDNAARLDLILSDAGSEAVDDEGDGKKTTVYDTRNAPAREVLRKLARKRRSTFTMQDRLFNGTGHIGHNKFVVHVDDAGVARSVLTGSTNWTWSGVAGQSNNCIRIDDDDVAAAYSAYWANLKADRQPTPKPLSARNAGAGQGDALKAFDQVPTKVDLEGGASIEVWFSPNVPGRNQPPKATTKQPPPPPPDMDRLFSLMRQARRSIFFLVFVPSRGGIHSIVSEAVALGQKDSSLEVVGAISDTQAMWGYRPGSTDDTGKKTRAHSPHVFEQGGVSVVRATALTDQAIGRPLGDFQFDETLTLGRAIIHDKILVLDPTDPVHCTVAFGSHNLGYKASYSNDENLVIVRGHRPLALAYAAHVLDVFDHYRFRAVEAERAASKKFSGFLDATDRWQASSSHRLSSYFTETPL